MLLTHHHHALVKVARASSHTDQIRRTAVAKKDFQKRVRVILAHGLHALDVSDIPHLV